MISSRRIQFSRLSLPRPSIIDELRASRCTIGALEFAIICLTSPHPPAARSRRLKMFLDSMDETQRRDAAPIATPVLPSKSETSESRAERASRPFETRSLSTGRFKCNYLASRVSFARASSTFLVVPSRRCPHRYRPVDSLRFSFFFERIVACNFANASARVYSDS